MLAACHLDTSRSERIVWLGADAAPGVARTRRNARGAVALVEEALGRTPLIAWERFTGADIVMPFWFTTALQFVPVDLAACPNVRAYLARLAGRPACRRAMELAGPGVRA